MPSQAEIRSEITADLIAMLEKGVRPWRKPWSNDPNCCGLPRNVSSRRAYSGINVLCLGASAMARGYSSPVWGTYRQFAALGGQVKRRPDDVPPGRWATTVVFYNQIERRKTDEAGQEKIEKFPIMKTYSVFNLEQVDGASLDHLRPGNIDVPEVFPDFDYAEETLRATNADIRHGGDRACYRRPIGEFPKHNGGDFIQMPLRKQFHTHADYLTTLAHELCHWSECRLGWTGSYGLGELQAELGSVYLAGALGIPLGNHLENHAAYLAAWVKEMKDDNRAIFRAAAMASKAADLVLSFSRQHENEPVIAEAAQEV